MQRRYQQEQVFKCLWSRKVKPGYFEPWFLPNSFSLIFRILLLIYELHVWVQREYQIDSFQRFIHINLEMTVISNEAVIAYCILGIKHYYSEDKMDSKLTTALSILWTFVCFWFLMDDIIFDIA